MRKRITKLIAILAMVFLVNMSSWGQWGNGSYDLSGIANLEVREYFAGTTPMGYFDKSVTVNGISYAAGITFPIGTPGGYTVNGGYTLDFFMHEVAIVQINGNSFGDLTVNQGESVVVSIIFSQNTYGVKVNGASVSTSSPTTEIKNSLSLGANTVTVMTGDGVKTDTWGCTVTVNAASVSVSSVSVSPTSATLTVGQTQQLTATVNPSNATNKAVTWSSNNTAVASVDASGLVTAQAQGTAVITVTTQDGGKTATCSVTVNAAAVPVTGVTLDQNSLTKTVGDPAVTLTATVQPTNATNQNVSWSTSNASVATVTNGVVNFVSAGTATITVTTQDGAKTATCSVTVNAAAAVPVTSVSVSPTSATLTVGQTQQLTATVLPSNATDKSGSWTSSNAAVASVSSSGLVTANAAGSATITFTTTDGGKTGTSSITVNVAPNSLTVSTNSLNYSSNGGSQSVTVTSNVTHIATNQVINLCKSATSIFSNSDLCTTNFRFVKGCGLYFRRR